MYSFRYLRYVVLLDVIYLSYSTYEGLTRRILLPAVLPQIAYNNTPAATDL